MTKASKGRLNGGGTAQHGDHVVSPNTSHNTLVIKSVFITLSKCWICVAFGFYFQLAFSL